VLSERRVRGGAHEHPVKLALAAQRADQQRGSADGHADRELGRHAKRSRIEPHDVAVGEFDLNAIIAPRRGCDVAIP
jgi:hypothetical protein